MKLSTKTALKEHMAKGKGAHPDPLAKKLAKGGSVSGAEMKRFGRNLARAKNQMKGGK